jgi:hypothetical protein
LNVTFLGLDGEMSGTDPRRHALIQIGLALSEEDIFESRIGWAEFEYEEEALLAIDVEPAQIVQGPVAAEVDARLVAWLDARGIGKGTVVPVGWGVSDFDRPFVHKTLPRFSEYLHHHSVELNAVVYTIAGTRRYLGADVDFAGWKKMAKKVAEFGVLNRRGSPPKHHDAADDALLAMLSWKWLREVIAVPSDEVALFESGRTNAGDGKAA